MYVYIICICMNILIHTYIIIFEKINCLPNETVTRHVARKIIILFFFWGGDKINLPDFKRKPIGGL